LDRIGVIDIGSNTVRLVVYDVASQLPIPMFNEKAACRLGAGLHETGVLNPDGVEQALISIERFVRLSRAMEVDELSLVATAAVRDAADGFAFVARLEAHCGVKIEILSGEQEAKLAAIGVMNGMPDANGVVCDLGGGSLDLVHIENHECIRYSTLPFGHLRLYETAGGDVGRACKMVASEIGKVGWDGQLSGATLYAVGGSIRALARLYIEQSSYPLHIVDNFRMPGKEARQLTELVSKLSEKTLRRIPSIPSKRVETLPMAAAAFEVLIEHFKPREVVFSAFGMREGKMLSLVPENLRSADPLIAGCEAVISRSSRFTLSGRELDEWMAPLFEGEKGDLPRSRLAACLVSDIGWHEHPDYRAEHAYHRVLRLPLAGMSHTDRVLMAVAVYVRYGRSMSDSLLQDVLDLIDDDTRRIAAITGFALRLGHRIAGSAPGLLAMTRLERGKKVLKLVLRENAPMFGGESVERRVKNLAQAIGVDYAIVDESA